MTVKQVKEKLATLTDETVLVGFNDAGVYYELETLDDQRETDYYNTDGELIKGKILVVG